MGAARPRRPGRPCRRGCARTRGARVKASRPDPRRRRADRRDPDRAASATAYDVNAEAAERAADGGPADPGAGDDPPGDPAAQPRRGPRRRRQRQDGAGAAAGQGADPGASASGRRSGWRCSATRSGWRSTSSARWRPGRATTGRRSSARSTSSAGSGVRPRATASDSEFWEDELPAVMGELVADVPDGQASTTRSSSTRRRTSPTRWWTPVLRCAARRGGGRALRLLRREPADLRPVRAAAGASSSRSCSTTTCATPSRSTSRSGRWRRAGCTPVAATGPTCASSPAPRTTRSDVADDEVEELLDAGWEPEHVALLTTGHRHPVQAAQTERHGQGLLAELLGRRGGLLRPRPRLQGARAAGGRAVRQRGRRAATASRERLYVGMSRATDSSSWSGDPDWCDGSVAERWPADSGAIDPTCLSVAGTSIVAWEGTKSWRTHMYCCAG